MKKTFLFIAVLFFTYAFSNAQGFLGKNPEESAERKTKKLNNELTNSKYLPLPLSADQQTKVKAIFLEYEQEAHPIRKKHEKSKDKKELRKELQSFKDKRDGQLKQVLTPDQYTKYTNMAYPTQEPAYFD